MIKIGGLERRLVPTSSRCCLGIPLVILARFTTKGDFFKQKPVAYTEIGD